jgi:hypothetical protein
MLQFFSVIGALLCLLPFAGVQLGKLPTTGMAYSGMNLVGSGILTVVAVIDGRFGFILLEGIWAIVSMVGMARVIQGRSGVPA